MKDVNQKKINFKSLKFKSKYYITKLLLKNYKTSILYVILISISMLVSLFLPKVVNILQENKFILTVFDKQELIGTFENIYKDTGIALIGLTGLIFTLSTFKKQSLNDYMNSVFQKMFDTKYEYYISYGYLSFVTVTFLLLPNFNIFENKISFFASFYYLSIITVLCIFAIELLNISNNLSKDKIIIKLERRMMELIKLSKNITKVFNKYSEEERDFIVKYLNKSIDSFFISYIQCINLIAKKSFDDPIIFNNAMVSLSNFVKIRLDSSRGLSKDNFVPLLSEVLPINGNDNFIEKYILEYLNEYSKLSLKNSNRDNFYTIQRMYKFMLINGRKNTYKDSKSLEMTIGIIFIYYLKMLEYVIEFGNENILFETVEIFKELFIKYGRDLVDLIGKNYTDEIIKLTKKSLNNKSLMNYRSMQALLSITLGCVLHNDDDYKEVKLKFIFDAFKVNINNIYINKYLMGECDEARVYMNYILSSIEPYSIKNIYLGYYNSNLDPETKYISFEKLKDKSFESLLDFISNKEVMQLLVNLHKERYYVTCDVDVKSIFEFILQISALISNSVEDVQIKQKYIHVFRRAFKNMNLYLCAFYNKDVKMYEADEFYSNIVHLATPIMKENEEIKNIIFEEYLNVLMKMCDSKDDMDMEMFEKYLKSVYEIFDKPSANDKTRKIITSLIANFTSIELTLNLCKDFDRNFHRMNPPIEYSNMKEIKDILLELIKEYLNTKEKQELVALEENYFEDNSKGILNKEEIINDVIERLSNSKK